MEDDQFTNAVWPNGGGGGKGKKIDTMEIFSLLASESHTHKKNFLLFISRAHTKKVKKRELGLSEGWGGGEAQTENFGFF